MPCIFVLELVPVFYIAAIGYVNYLFGEKLIDTDNTGKGTIFGANLSE